MLLVSLFFVFSIMFVVPSYALNLENKILVSDDENLIIEFGKNTVRSLLTETITSPNLEFGIIRLVDQEIFLDVSDNVSVSILGNSIAIKSLDVPVIIYARNVGDNNYSINLYTIDDGFKKQTFTATLETKTLATIKTVEEIVTEPLMNVLVRHSERVYSGDTFRFSVKIFDVNVYDGNDWAVWDGMLGEVNISAKILGLEDQTLGEFNGITSNGYFEDSMKVPQNIWREGWYTLLLTAEHQNDIQQKELKFYNFGGRVPDGGKGDS